MSGAGTVGAPVGQQAAASRPAARLRARRRALGTLGLAAALALALPAAAAASVVVVGDSLGVGTEGPLRAALGGVAVDADSLNGRPSAAGLPVLAGMLGPEHETVVFDLGTNDGNAAVATTATSLAAAHQAAGGRCLVVATLNRPPMNGVPIDGQNAMIRRFAAATPNVALVDWNDVAESTPGVLQPDGVHATAGGYALRGLLFADAIATCGPVTGGGGGSDPQPRAAASTTDAPASQRRPRPRPQRKRPSLPARVAAATVAGLTGADGPLALAQRGGRLVAAAAQSVGAVATPRGPEPVLGES